MFESIREESFAPLKNAVGQDSPETASKLLEGMHKKWLEREGVKFEGEGKLEIHPRVSYQGEGLLELVKKRFESDIVKLPCYIDV